MSDYKGMRRMVGAMLPFVGVALAPLAFAQSCSNYKNQLEPLLVLPAGKYRVEEFWGSTEQKTITLKNGRTVWLNTHGDPKESPEPDGRVTVPTYLEYQLPRSPLKVTDSTTKGRRVANGRLSCVYVVSYPPFNRPGSIEVDVQVSDSGKAEFFASNLTTSLVFGDNPDAYVRVTAKEGASVAFGLISDGLRERDRNHPGLQDTARQSYAAKVANAQAKQDAERPKYLQLVRDCQNRLMGVKRDIDQAESAYNKQNILNAADMTFGECTFTHLPKPSQWISSGAKPFDSPSSPAVAGQSATAAMTPAAGTAQSNGEPIKSPKEDCASKNNFIARAICMVAVCSRQEYKSLPDCPKAQPPEGQQ